MATAPGAAAATAEKPSAAPPALPVVKLANGVQMPQVGFGCAFGNWTDPEGFNGMLPEQAWRAVTLALDAGYRHFDTALAYGTERQIGSILGAKFATGELQRRDVHITTKVAHPVAPPHVAISHRRTFNPRDVPDIGQRVDDDFDRSLDDLGVGYVDLLLMHWPGTFDETDAKFAAQARLAIWRRFESYVKKGTARAIGVCNFTVEHLDELWRHAEIKPQVNQIEIHPYCQQPEMEAYCAKHGIVLEAYAPFASGAFGLLKDPVLTAIAEEAGASVGQVVLRWHVQRGHVVLPKSSSAKRMGQNLDLFGFELTPEQMAAIDALGTKAPDGKPQRTCPDPATVV